mmetsp:Transcript_17081/g.21285  ORF Transcript_17081/g.21285 Transcript_17081/m.21285 type:complete len:365 (-) Transcript_17081:240-1334(-)
MNPFNAKHRNSPKNFIKRSFSFVRQHALLAFMITWLFYCFALHTYLGHIQEKRIQDGDEYLAAPALRKNKKALRTTTANNEVSDAVMEEEFERLRKKFMFVEKDRAKKGQVDDDEFDDDEEGETHVEKNMTNPEKEEAADDDEEEGEDGDDDEEEQEGEGQAQVAQEEENDKEGQEQNDDDDDDDGEWEDIDDGDASFDGYDDVIKSHGFGVTELGELILPDGRIVGHRTLSVYYKQRFAPDRTNDAVSAQRRTERERILGYGSSAAAAAEAGHGGAAITSSDAVSGRALQARGRQGQGILVKGTGVSGFSQISVYRYRAAVRKERRDEAKYYRRKMKNRYNMNRMDKKANRLMNGVSVAHALR